MTLQQLTYSGVFEAITMSAEACMAHGTPHRSAAEHVEIFLFFFLLFVSGFSLCFSYLPVSMLLSRVLPPCLSHLLCSRKQGFPFRLSHEDFYKRFKCILPKKTWPNHKTACVELIAAMGQDVSLVQMGVTKVGRTAVRTRMHARAHGRHHQSGSRSHHTLTSTFVIFPRVPFSSAAGAVPCRRAQEHGAQAKRQCNN